MKKDTFVYAYKGVIGIKSSEDCAGLLNYPCNDNGMLYLIDTKNVKFSAEAIELLNKIPVGADCIGDVMSYNAGDVKVFGFRGGPAKVIGKVRPETKKAKKKEQENAEVVYVTVYGDVGYRPELLVATEGIEPDASFKKFVDSMEAKSELQKFVI